jgi:hypothetical protein
MIRSWVTGCSTDTNPHDHEPFAPAQGLPAPTFHAAAGFSAAFYPYLCHRRREKLRKRAASRYAAGLRTWHAMSQRPHCHDHRLEADRSARPGLMIMADWLPQVGMTGSKSGANADVPLSRGHADPRVGYDHRYADAGVEAAPYPRRVIPVTTHARPRALQYKATMTSIKACCSAALRVFARSATARTSCTE